MSAKRPQKRAFKSLQYFLNRSQVLAQYREFLRITQPLESDVKRDVRQQIRGAYDLYRDIDDEKQVAHFLRQGKDQLKHVSDLVDSAVARQRLAEEQHLNARVVPVVSNSADTWVDTAKESSTGDGGEQEDVRGRVGTGWPWKKDEPVRKIELEGIRRR